jgi:hypothetical protein
MALRDWPLDIVPQQAGFTLEPNAVFNESPLSRAQTVSERQGARWRATLVWSNATEDIAGPLEGLTAWLNGGVNEVLLWDFRRPQPRGTAAVWGVAGAPTWQWSDPGGSLWSWSDPGGAPFNWADAQPPTLPRTQIGAPKGATQLVTWGWAANSTVLRGGDRIGVGGRLYQVSFTVTTDPLGVATLDIQPALRDVVGPSVRIFTDRPTTRFRLPGVGVEVQSSPGGAGVVNGVFRAEPITQLQIELVESLP